MNNPYCRPFKTVRDLYVQYMKEKSREDFDDWAKKLSREEIKQQLDAKKGSMVDKIWERVRSITRKTEFVEFLASLQLADFYFPNEKKTICFELKRNVRPEEIKTYEGLINSLESNTHIDCQIKNATQTISFQIKRDGSDNGPAGFATWLKEKVLKKYSNMVGTSLVIFLGVPKDGSGVDLAKFYAEFMKICSGHISFDKISLLYNDKTAGNVVLHEFYPNHKRVMIKSDLAMARFRGEA